MAAAVFYVVYNTLGATATTAALCKVMFHFFYSYTVVAETHFVIVTVPLVSLFMP
jgi:hypothetical protein